MQIEWSYKMKLIKWQLKSEIEKINLLSWINNRILAMIL